MNTGLILKTVNMLVLLLAMIGTGLLMYLFYILQEKGADKLHQDNMKILRNRYPGVFQDNTRYEFYQTGHPYVWVKTTQDEVVESLRMCCSGFRGFPQTPIFSLCVDKAKKRVYYARGYRDFDFASLVHYHEWLEAK